MNSAARYSLHSRPLGITIIVWGLIIYIGLPLILLSFNLRKLAHNLFILYPPPLQLVWLISSSILIGFIVGGIQALKLKELGRSLIVFLAIIDIPHLIVGKAIYNNHNMQPMHIRNSHLITTSIAIDLILLYFFNHPKVKKQFK
jgi:hypothetical protein